MKCFLLFAALLISVVTAQAQITLEHRYGTAYFSNFAVTKFSNGELKYVTVSSGSTPVATVYNENHSVLKQMTLPVVANASLNAIYLVSDKLFNQDAAIEYVCGYETLIGNNPRYRLIVANESGTQLLVADTVAYSDAARIVQGATGIKLLIPTGRLDATGASVRPDYTKVYALGGTSIPTAVRASSANTDELPYPNPTNAKVTLPYEVPAGQRATLQVLDMLGRSVRQYTVDERFKSLELSTQDLAAGTYIYRVVNAAGVSTAGRRFVIQETR